MVDAPAPAGGVPTFAVDKMLGRLARWLRILGHDVAYGPHLHGRTLLACARRDRRLLLTRDTRLLRRRDLPPHLFVQSDRFRDQLREVAAAVPLDQGGLLRRCLSCNRPLHPVEHAAAEGRVPPYVFATQTAFLGCSGCGRLFWPATHRAHVLHELRGLGIAPAEGGAP